MLGASILDSYQPLSKLPLSTKTLGFDRLGYNMGSWGSLNRGVDSNINSFDYAKLTSVSSAIYSDNPLGDTTEYALSSSKVEDDDDEEEDDEIDDEDEDDTDDEYDYYDNQEYDEIVGLEVALDHEDDEVGEDDDIDEDEIDDDSDYEDDEDSELEDDAEASDDDDEILDSLGVDELSVSTENDDWVDIKKTLELELSGEVTPQTASIQFEDNTRGSRWVAIEESLNSFRSIITLDSYESDSYRHELAFSETVNLNNKGN